MVTLVIIVITAFITYNGLKNYEYTEKYIFSIEGLVYRNEKYRLLSSGFLHGGWLHFGLNMFALYSFGSSIERISGSLAFTVLYFGSLIGGSLLAWLIHKNDSGYRALGASGAVSGIIFASVYLDPNSKLSLFFIPMPKWLFAILFVGISLYGMKARLGNIGHDAHLGGAITGLLIMIGFYPFLLEQHWWLVALLVIPSLVLIYIFVKNPHIFLGGNPFKKKTKGNPLRYETMSRQKQLDLLLDKVRKKGMNSLTPKERQKLDDLSDLMGG